MRKATQLFSFLASLTLAVSFAPAFADTATPAPTPAAPSVTVDGLVDTYFTYNFTNAANSALGGGNGSLYSFNTTDNAFTLGLAEAAFTATQGQASAHLTLMYGQTADIISAGSETGIGIEQAYVSYAPGDWTFNAGKFVTWMGNEVIESKSNWNYSRSLLFFAIPLWHTGVSVGVAPDPKIGITGYVTDGWNSEGAFSFGGEKTFGLQVAIHPGADSKGTGDLSIVLNGLAGPRHYDATDDSLDFATEGIVTWSATDKLSLALDAQFSNDDFGVGPGSYQAFGAALYGRYQISSDYAVALRLEDLVDYDYAVGGDPAVPGAIALEMREATLTFEHNLTPNMLFRVEGRMDQSDADGTTLPIYAGGSTSQFTGTASSVFSF